MTGHVGERRNRTVALVTHDLRDYHRLVPVFESQGIPILGVGPEEEIPETVAVLLNGPANDERSVALRADDEATLLAVLHRLDGRPTAADPSGYREVVFGVDPGETIGLAVVADGLPLMVAVVHSPNDAVTRIQNWITGLSATSWRLHVGDGAPPIGNDLLALASDLLPSVSTHIISEKSTTPRAPATGNRHTDAAIHIAFRRP